MVYKDVSIAKYTEDLAAKIPAPGGGSAAALNAAMATALVSMTIRYTLGKPKYAAYEVELKKILDKSEKLRQEFLRLVDLDVVAYNSNNIRDALAVPLMLCRLCYEGMRLCPVLIKKANNNLITDVAVAAIFFESAYSAALFNVDVNLKTLGDEKLTRVVHKELLHKRELVKKTRRLVEEKIGKVIRG
jgi:methenyltetrahydrofolate cyclohydrolase